MPAYSLQNRPFSTHEHILRFVGRGKRVLEIGCAGGYLAELLTAQGCTVTGIEIDPRAASQARRFCNEVIVGDAETLQLKFREKFDVIVLADVLEHLRDPARLLRRLTAALKPGGYLVISVPNVANWTVRVLLLLGRFDYEDRGILDRTHRWFYTLRSFEGLVSGAGYHIAELEINSPIPTARRLWPIRWLAHSIGMLRKQFFAYQFIAVARKA